MGVWGCFSEDNFQNTQAFARVIDQRFHMLAIYIGATVVRSDFGHPLPLTGKVSTALQALPCPADAYCLGRDRRHTAFDFQKPFRCLEVERRPA